MDDFAIKYTNKADLDHLLECIREKYPVKVDWDAKQYIGINFEWNYKERTVGLSTQNYVAQALAQFKHNKPTQFHYGPSRMNPIRYGAKVQYSKPTGTRPISDTD